MQSRQEQYQEFDTILYQGANCNQAQAMHPSKISNVASQTAAITQPISFFKPNPINNKEETRNQIIYNLKTLKVNENSINKILNAIDSMPASEHLLGALKFLTELTDQRSRCEHFYVHSDHIAEYFCTLSNLGLFAVAFYCQDYVTLFAATFSALSHAIPLKRLNDLDKLAAVTTFLNVLVHFNTLTYQPLLVAGAITATFGVLDMYVGRKHMDVFGPTFHAAWHLAAAYALFQFNRAQTAKVSAQEIEALGVAIQQNNIPNYLKDSYGQFSRLLSDLSNVMVNKIH